MEPLAYYFGLKPQDFWNGTFREINIYCQANIAKHKDKLKQDIDLQENATNKLISGDCMNQNAKIILIRDSYKELYETEEKEQTLEEQRRLFKG